MIRSCHDLGLRAVAVYSDIDRDALHVRAADAAYPIGPAAPRESYLNAARLIEVAKRSGCRRRTANIGERSPPQSRSRK